MGNEINLHIGCGNNYLPNYVNIDNNPNVKADLYLDINQPLPFKDNSISSVISEGCIEHIRKDFIFDFYDELWRICKNGAKITLLTNHFTSVWAMQHLGHQVYYGVDSFNVMQPNKCFNGERYTKARFRVEKVRLHFFYPKLVNYGWLNKLPIDWLFNFSRGWQRVMERFQFLGFDGIAYQLSVVKGVR